MHHVLVLAGGGGTRLWPASRRTRPKQFLPLARRSGESLLAATVHRVLPLVPAERVWVVTAAEQAPEVWRTAPQLPKGNVIAEPAARNTAGAVGLAAVVLRHRDPDAVLAVLPADHHVADEDTFRDTVGRALALAEGRDAIVTIGLSPTGPETGFGYLELGADIGGGAREVARFVEKPDRKTAEAYVSSGRYLWNGGMFFFRAERILREIRIHLPAMADALDEIAHTLEEGGEAAAMAATARLYPHVESVSIDYGVMEKTSGIVTLPGHFGWNDVGSWSALAEIRDPDGDGNVTEGLVLAEDARGNIAVCDEKSVVALVGVEGLVVVKHGNAVLVVPRARAQEVRSIVKELEARKLDRFL